MAQRIAEKTDTLNNDDIRSGAMDDAAPGGSFTKPSVLVMTALNQQSESGKVAVMGRRWKVAKIRKWLCSYMRHLDSSS